MPEHPIKEVPMSFLKYLSTVKRKRERDNLRSGEGDLIDEKRKHPRMRVELPLGFSRADRVDYEEIHAGIVANASEGGVLVYLPEPMEIGVVLKTEIMYMRGYELDTIKGIARVVWSDLAPKESLGDYRCGLRFDSFQEDDFPKLKILLNEAGEETDLTTR